MEKYNICSMVDDLQIDDLLSSKDLATIEKAIDLGCSLYKNGDYTLAELLEANKKIIGDTIKMKLKKTYKIKASRKNKVEVIVLDYKCQEFANLIEKKLEKYALQRIEYLLSNKEIVTIEDSKHLGALVYKIGLGIGIIVGGVLIVL